MDIAVVDDEKVIREHIREMIENQKPDCHVACFSSGEEFLNAAKAFDIVFLDIQMDGMNGIEAAKETREMNADTVLIFITGIKEYVFEALDLYAFHYLLKPVTKQKFTEVFGQALREAGLRKMRRKKQLFINTRNKGITIDADNILYIESVSRKVEIHTTQEIIEAYGALGELETQLGGTFYRCHRGVSCEYGAHHGIQKGLYHTYGWRNCLFDKEKIRRICKCVYVVLAERRGFLCIAR